MAIPTNLTGATAIDLGPLPNSIVQDVRDVGTATTYPVFYRYTNTSGVPKIVDVWAYGGLGTYEPVLYISTDPSGAPLYLGISSFNRPTQFPALPGVTYYLQADAPDPSATPAILTISGLEAPPLDPAAIPIGSVLINDDTDGFPLAVMSPIDGSILGFVYPFPSGEEADILTDGHSLWHDGGGFFLFDAAFTQIWQHTLVGIAIIRNPPISSNHVDKFYIGSPGIGAIPAVAISIDLNQVEGPVIGPFPTVGLQGIAPSLDDTILYFVQSALAAGSKIERWDLGSNTALSDLTPVETGYAISLDLVVFPDGSIVAGYNKSDDSDHYLKRFAPDGTLLATYPLDPDDHINRLARGADDTSIWVWIYPVSDTTFNRLKEIRISDGALLHSWDRPQYEVGVYQPAETATPDRFGSSFSCPVVISRGSVTPPIPPGPPGCPVGEFPMALGTNRPGCPPDFPVNSEELPEG